MKIHLIAIGRVRGPEAALADEYAGRITGGIHIRELATATQKQESEALLAAIPPKAFVVALDERGRDVSSAELAQLYARWRDEGPQDLVFLIGGADGHTDAVRDRANYLLSLGKKTWPHKLVRVMLLEQIYRAQQIDKGHPYHRE